MDTTHTMTRIITGALLSGALVLAGWGLAAGTAQAAPPAGGAKVAVADFRGAHIRTVADGFLGDIVALDDSDDWEQQQEELDEEQATQQMLQTEQEIQEANQEAEEQNELATQEAQQAEQQGLMTEQQADLSYGFGQ